MQINTVTTISLTKNMILKLLGRDIIKGHINGDVTIGFKGVNDIGDNPITITIPITTDVTVEE